MSAGNRTQFYQQLTVVRVWTAGLNIGNYFARGLNPAIFANYVLGFLFSSATIMLFADTPAQPPAILTMLAVLLIILLYILGRGCASSLGYKTGAARKEDTERAGDTAGGTSIGAKQQRGASESEGTDLAAPPRGGGRTSGAVPREGHATAAGLPSSGSVTWHRQ